MSSFMSYFRSLESAGPAKGDDRSGCPRGTGKLCRRYATGAGGVGGDDVEGRTGTDALEMAELLIDFVYITPPSVCRGN